MRRLDLMVFEPGDTFGTLSADGQVQIWRIATGGTPISAGSPLPDPDLHDLRRDSPIEALELTVRTYNLLKRENISTVGEMFDIYISRGPEGLLDIRNFGQRSVDEVAGWVERLKGMEP